MFPFRRVTKRIRSADHELSERPRYLLIILHSSLSSMTTTVKDSVGLHMNRSHTVLALQTELYLFQDFDS